ncbi:MAG: DUF3417 domain-containing protein, partial [Actinomycetota bacterium]|nr:DUF3417 domain-containing protein [Actinomycetota bacterium]
VHDRWRGVHVDEVEAGGVGSDLGQAREVEAVVSLGELGADDAAVQLLHGGVGLGDELTDTAVVTMALAGEAHDGHLRYRGGFICDRPGRYGYTVRVVPSHPHLVTPVELGRVAWA